MDPVLAEVARKGVRRCIGGLREVDRALARMAGGVTVIQRTVVHDAASKRAVVDVLDVAVERYRQVEVIVLPATANGQNTPTTAPNGAKESSHVREPGSNPEAAAAEAALLPKPKPSDGDKGRSAPPSNPDLAFDADDRADRREAAPIVIGGMTFTRRRKNWSTTRGLRRLMRTQEHSAVKQARISRQLEELGSDATDDEFDRLQKEADDLMDTTDRAAYEMLVALLKDEQGGSPDLDFLMENMDVEDTGALAQRLAAGGEPDPTPKTATT
jgi:hypothetical protein